MIEYVEVRNWQSLRSVSLVMGPLTVIVGPSSSGKTALIRALKALASNVRGSGSITRGAKAAAVSVRTGDAMVTLERTEASGLYRIVGVDGREVVYTKLAGAVPQAVTDALRIDPVPSNGTSLNFAGQFDPPYLLDNSGASVARALGELTKVTTIFEAVREASRRRNAAAAKLRVKEADLVDLAEQVGQYRDLAAKLRACERAEEAAHRAVQLRIDATGLRAAMRTLEAAEDVLSRSPVPPHAPSDTRVVVAQNRWRQCDELIREWTDATNRAEEFATGAKELLQREEALRDQLHETLVAAGICPTCRQPVVADAG